MIIQNKNHRKSLCLLGLTVVFCFLNYKTQEDILDNMGSEELADNIFRIAQTDAKLKRDKVDNEYTANSVHYEIGKIVRKAVEEAGGTMPEDLPTPNKSLKELEIETKKLKE